MVTDSQYIEDHPIFHDWYFATDEIREVNSRKVPVIIWRHMKCRNCPTTSIDVIDVYNWERIGSRRYRYQKDTVINRIPKQQHLKDRFLATTDLPLDFKMLLAKRKAWPD